MTANKTIVQMTKQEVIDTCLEIFKMKDPIVQKSDGIKRTYSNAMLYDRFEKIAEVMGLMGQIEFTKGEKAQIIKNAKELGINL